MSCPSLVDHYTFTVVKILGALYLGYLGLKSLKEFFKSIRAQNTPINKDEELREVNNSPIKNNSTQKHEVRKYGRFLRVGWLAQLLNPKVSVFYLAVLPNFVDFTVATTTVDNLILTTTHASIVGSWFLIVATVSNQLLPYFKGVIHWTMVKCIGWHCDVVFFRDVIDV